MSALVFMNAKALDGKDLEMRVENGQITEAGARVTRRADDRLEDLGGAMLASAFFDPHVHFREPGEAYKETLETGSRAAAAGGYSDVAVMPNTNPPLDEAYRVRGVIARGAEIGLCRLHAIGACTLGLAGERLTEMAALKDAGAIGFSDDGRPVANAVRMRRALEWARGLGTVIVTHAEELSLRGDGVMHEGATATRLGLSGIPAACETTAVARDIELAALTGARLHVAHVSTARAVDLVREAKRRGLAVTAETAPHYLMFTDEDVARFGSAAKMNPPLRTAADREALIAGLADGTLDCLATDHAPHTVDEKAQPFADAPFGVVGLETALAAALTVLHHQGGMTIANVVERLSSGPRRVFGLPAKGIAPGAPADLVAFDPDAEWTVEPEKFATKGRATPFAGARLKGRVLGTWIEGRETFRLAPTMAGAR
ncbi:MAG TPA: dihydroorotase [Candidatus Eisenbacteria bacterium]|nr:dihydroorotase [Candidatus Eisenbacteria bacterium]